MVRCLAGTRRGLPLVSPRTIRSLAARATLLDIEPVLDLQPPKVREIIDVACDKHQSVDGGDRRDL